MPVTIEMARDLVESVFTFDNVGEGMTKLRRESFSKEAKEELIDQLVESSKKESADMAEADIPLIKQAAKEQVEQFIQSAVANESGCGGMTKLA